MYRVCVTMQHRSCCHAHGPKMDSGTARPSLVGLSWPEIPKHQQWKGVEETIHLRIKYMGYFHTKAWFLLVFWCGIPVCHQGLRMTACFGLQRQCFISLEVLPYGIMVEILAFWNVAFRHFRTWFFRAGWKVVRVFFVCLCRKCLQRLAYVLENLLEIFVPEYIYSCE